MCFPIALPVYIATMSPAHTAKKVKINAYHAACSKETVSIAERDVEHTRMPIIADRRKGLRQILIAASQLTRTRRARKKPMTVASVTKRHSIGTRAMAAQL